MELVQVSWDDEIPNGEIKHGNQTTKQVLISGSKALIGNIHGLSFSLCKLVAHELHGTAEGSPVLDTATHVVFLLHVG